MNEEIDIIELFRRVKEGKAPKRIQIAQMIFHRNDKQYSNDIENLYIQRNSGWRDEYWFECIDAKIDTKIKILDKPIIEELELHPDEIQNSTERKMENKINEIIRQINKEEK